MTVQRQVVTARSMRALVTAIAFAGFAAACGSSTTSPSTVASISVTGSAPVVGATSQLAAAAVLSDGTTQDVTSVATWQSSDTSLATVSSTGLVTGIAEGAVVVQAAYSGVTGSMSITIP